MWRPADPEGIRISPEFATLDFHIHVAGNSSSLYTGKSIGGTFPNQKPSNDGGDIGEYRPKMEAAYPNLKLISSVLGAGNGTLYLYNSSGVYAKFGNMIQILQDQKSSYEKLEIKYIDLGSGAAIY